MVLSKYEPWLSVRRSFIDYFIVDRDAWSHDNNHGHQTKVSGRIQVVRSALEPRTSCSPVDFSSYREIRFFSLNTSCLASRCDKQILRVQIYSTKFQLLSRVGDVTACSGTQVNFILWLFHPQKRCSQV